MHWASKYKHAISGTLEHAIYLVACYSLGRTEGEVKAIARIVYEQKTSVFHASWQHSKLGYPCPCSPCENARKQASGDNHV